MDWIQRVRDFHARGTRQRAETPFSIEDFPFVLQRWDADDKCDWHHMPEGLGPTGRLYLQKIVREMRAAKSVAAIFQADVRQLDVPAFTAHFGLKGPVDSDEWNEERLRIIRSHGGDYGNLPRNTWRDAILTGVKGPEIPAYTIRTTYIGNDKDEVVMEVAVDTGESTIRMIPDWW